MRRIMLGMALLGACTEGPGGVEPEGPDGDCFVERLTDRAALVTVDGLELVVPEGTVTESQDLVLCPEDSEDPAIVSPRWTIGPDTLELQQPVEMRVAFGGDPTIPTRLFVPAAGGGVRPDFDAEGVDAGQMSGTLLRTGPVYVAADARELRPYRGIERADVLLVVDRSTDMGPIQSRWEEPFQDLLTGLLDTGLDVHLGVTTTDMTGEGAGQQGNLRESDGRQWIDPETPAPDRVLTDYLDVGTGGTHRRGLAAAEAALFGAAASSHEGFLREQLAHLAVIFVSNGDYDPEVGDITDTMFENALVAARNPPATASAHAITPLTAGSYLNVVGATGGEFVAIGESSWAPVIGAVLEQVQSARAMRLPRPVREETLEVWWIPEAGEPERLDGAGVDYDEAAGTVLVDLAGRPPEQIFLLVEER